MATANFDMGEIWITSDDQGAMITTTSLKKLEMTDVYKACGVYQRQLLIETESGKTIKVNFRVKNEDMTLDEAKKLLTPKKTVY